MRVNVNIATAILTVFILYPAAVLSRYLYRNNAAYDDSQRYSDYHNATGGELINAAARKITTLGAGTQCSSVGGSVIYISPAGLIVEGEITPQSNTNGGGILAGCEASQCGTLRSFDNSSITATTPADSRLKLETSQNVAVPGLASYTYVLTISPNR